MVRGFGPETPNPNKPEAPLPIGSVVVPFYGLYVESYNKEIPTRNYSGAFG